MALSMQAMLELLDDDARALAETLLRDAPAPPYSQYGVPAVRAIVDGVSRPPAQIEVPEVLDVGIGTPDGELTVRCYRPSLDRELPVLMYVHGGGFVLGTLDGVDDVCRSLAVAAGCAVVSVEYRRAPEWVFPAAADDCLAVYDWLERRGGELGIDASRVALAGDSAGGNLVLSVCTSLAAARRRLPACLVVAYPATSADCEGPSWEAFEHAPVLCKADAEWFWSAYADAEARRDPRAVPELSTSLHALPPVLVVSAEVDPLRSDYERFAALAARAGVEVEVRNYDGVAHGFFTEVRTLRKAQQAVADAASFLRAHLLREQPVPNPGYAGRYI